VTFVVGIPVVAKPVVVESVVAEPEVAEEYPPGMLVTLIVASSAAP
jgi:hypothetical protein